MTSKALILGCQGPSIEAEERRFLSDANPWGLILFRRNIVDRDQVLALTRDFRSIVGRDDAPVLIDQEGGRVQRMGPPNWRKYPPAAQYLIASNGDIEAAAKLARIGSRLIAHDLRQCGITIDCLPVLDCRQSDTTDAIGDRAYGYDPEPIAVIGRAAAEGLLDGGVLPVMKHMPGHGRARVDSHQLLPRVKDSLDVIDKTDFYPFKKLNDLPIGMTGHIVFEAVDPNCPATLSSIVINTIIRQKIGFDGLLLSDDVSMKALSGGFGERTAGLFAAGCDIVLHCNGNREEAAAVAEAAPVLEGKGLERARRALETIQKPISAFDPVEAAKILEAKLALGA